MKRMIASRERLEGRTGEAKGGCRPSLKFKTPERESIEERWTGMEAPRGDKRQGSFASPKH